jgi:hypothetical protein
MSGQSWSSRPASSSGPKEFLRVLKLGNWLSSQGVMRQFLSKSIAGGLSAGVVLLWWPRLFEDVDTLTSWLLRGAAWTICLEVLMLALIPFERALWETAGGERISSRVGAANSRLHSGSHRRRLGRLSAIATVAVAAPVALLVMGLQGQPVAQAGATPVRPIEVVRVTKVVKVKRVVQHAPVASRTIESSAGPSMAAPAATRPSSPSTAERVVVGRAAPVQRQSAPSAQPEVSDDSGEACAGDACGSSAPPAAAPAF